MAKRARKARTEEMWMGHNKDNGFLPWAYGAATRRFAEDRLRREGETKATIVHVRITEILPKQKRSKKGAKR